MTTYGWAFLVIIASVGVLTHFGFLSPSKYIPESCDFGEQLECMDHYLDTGKDMRFRFQNNFEAKINITEVNITNQEDATIKGFTPTVIEEGAIMKVPFEIDGVELDTSRKENFKITITFKRVGSTVEHTISGTVFTKVREESLVES
ncbi:MAG: hypothetical protein ACLFTH_02825 [Candidatus Woesearchaeota archaeon]